MNTNRLLRISVFFLSLLPGLLPAQGFTIDRFRTDIFLRRDGSFEVVETIDADFYEDRHGIRRLIPYRYVPTRVEGEVALNHTPGISYKTPLDSVRVIGHEYLVEKEYDNYNIRIGSADSYVSGKVRYEIRYIVYSAINRFLSHDELYWNVNGNGWDVPADTVEVEVHLPDDYQLKTSDFRLFTGFKGAKGTDATGETGKGYFRAQTTRTMEAHEGLTFVLKLRSGYLEHGDLPLRMQANSFIVHDMKTEVDLELNGSAVVTETFDLEIKGGMYALERRLGTRFPYSWLSEHLEHHPVDLKVEMEEVFSQEAAERKEMGHRISENGAYLGLQMDFEPEAGRRTYQIRYRLWNVMEFAKGEGRFYFPWMSYGMGEPIVNSRCVIRWPKGMILDTARSQIIVSDLERIENGIFQDSILMVSRSQLQPDFTASVAVVLHGEWSQQKTPMRLYSPEKYFQRFNLALEVRKDGSVNFDHDIVFINNSFDSRLECRIREWSLPWYSDTIYQTARPNVFGYDGRFLLFEEDWGEGKDYRNGLWGTIVEFASESLAGKKNPTTATFSYSLFGMMYEMENGGYHFNFPIVEDYDFAADSVHFTIALPDDLQLDTSQVQAFVVNSNDQRSIEAQLSFAPGKVEGVLDPGLFPNSRLILSLELPEGLIQPSLWLRIRMTYRNHPMVFLPLLVLLILTVLWLVFGRDKRFTKVVRFRPPENLTPTEAGLLIDDKLHNRDLLALIYYWGARGNIRISEVPGKDGKVSDYSLTKLKKLPKGSRKYERTLFNALFLGRETIRVSKLRHQFYIYMRQARGQVETWAKKQNFYVPGTRGFGRWLRGIGILLLIIAGLLGGYILIFWQVSMDANWGPVIGWGLTGTLLLLFSRIMPRHGAYGLKRYAELRGFMEFVKTAEEDRLRRLLDEDPDYFGLTLSYAIALGMANRWVEKFGPLLAEPPSYYNAASTSTDTGFNAAYFNHMLSRQLSDMARNFNSSPPSSGGGSYSGGGYSGGSSWSSSSSSSFGSSGGSGFSSGGGYSGGGYGGGGGSSW